MHRFIEAALSCLTGEVCKEMGDKLLNMAKRSAEKLEVEFLEELVTTISDVLLKPKNSSK